MSLLVKCQLISLVLLAMWIGYSVHSVNQQEQTTGVEVVKKESLKGDS